MVNRRNKTLAKKGGKCGCSLMGGSYYKYNDLRNATPRDFLLSERMPAKTANHMNFPLLTAGGKRRSKRQTFKRRTIRRTRRRVKRRVGRKSSRKQKRSRKQKGGIGRETIIPQDLVNVGRSGMHGIGSFANAFKGIAETASPLPTEDQLNNSYDFVYKPVDLPQIRAGAEAKVSKL
jgi:hypothetical protein